MKKYKRLVIIVFVIILGISYVPDLVNAESVVDTTAPELASFTLEKTTVEAPGKIKVRATVTDDISGGAYVRAVFTYRVETDENDKGSNIYVYMNQETGKYEYYKEYKLSVLLDSYYSDNENEEETIHTDGILGGNIDISQYMPEATYTIDYISVEDKAGNYKYYDDKRDSAENLPDFAKGLSINVKNNRLIDTTAPELASFTLEKTTVEAPGKIKVRATVTDDISGGAYVRAVFTYRVETDENDKGSNIYVYMNQETGKYEYYKEYKLSVLLDSYYSDNENEEETIHTDGILGGNIDISQYMPEAIYTIDYISVEDKAGNYKYYDDKRDSAENLPDFVKNMAINIRNNSNKSYEVTTGTSNADMVSSIQNASNDAIIKVDYTTNDTLVQGVFDAIKGTNKILSLESEGVTWEFNGSDITQPTKNINLSVYIGQVNQTNSNMNSNIFNEIKDIVDNTNSVVLKFAENGVLPGKAKVRIKTDYVMRQYLGTRGVNVYYYDNMTKKMVPIASNLTLTADNYLEFEIEHCSYYVMTKGALSSLTQPNNTTLEPSSDDIHPSDDEEVAYNDTTVTSSVVTKQLENAIDTTKTTTTAPKTGDNTVLFILIYAIAAGGSIFTICKIKRL